MAVVAKRAQPDIIITRRKRVSVQPKSKVDIWTKSVRIYLAVILLGTLLILLYVGQYASMVQAEYRLSQVKDKIKKIQDENYRLQLDMERLRSRERIERIARNRLGMVKPKVVEFMESTPFHYRKYVKNPKDFPKDKDKPQVITYLSFNK